MKIKDYRTLKDNLRNALEFLKESYEVDTSEDEEWSNRHTKVINEITGLLEEMIFTFRIED